MDNQMEFADPFEARDLLVAEGKSSDVVREVVAGLLRGGMTPAQLLAEVPTLSEGQIRAALATMN
jgi:hypoxanthine phosphoribosyltransferase